MSLRKYLINLYLLGGLGCWYQVQHRTLLGKQEAMYFRRGSIVATPYFQHQQHLLFLMYVSAH